MNLKSIAAWPYFHPVFSQNQIIAQTPAKAVALSAVNLAVWSAAIGFTAKLAGFKHPYRIAAGAFGVLVAAEVLFGISSGAPGGISAGNGRPPGTSTPDVNVNGSVSAWGNGSGFSDGENNDFGSAGNGFGS